MGSFLLNRTQQVKIGKTVSSVGNPKGGVPHGTVSGPRNFIMFINNLTTTAPIYKYVDDSTICEVCQEGDTTQIQESVDMVDIWTNQNDMRLNSEKCIEMIKSNQIKSSLFRHHIFRNRFRGVYSARNQFMLK